MSRNKALKTDINTSTFPLFEIGIYLGDFSGYGLIFKVWAILSGFQEVGSSHNCSLHLPFCKEGISILTLYYIHMKSQLWNDLISFSFLIFLLSPSRPLPANKTQCLPSSFEDGHEPFSKGCVILRDKFTLSTHLSVYPL